MISNSDNQNVCRLSDDELARLKELKWNSKALEEIEWDLFAAYQHLNKIQWKVNNEK